MNCRIAGVTFLTSTAIFAQEVVGAADLAAPGRKMDAVRSSPRLACEFIPIRPSLTFALKFETGYRVDVPLNQFPGGGDVNILTRVTPSHGRPVYLISNAPIPTAPKGPFDGAIAGRFVVGEGSYRIEVLVEDGARTCKGRMAGSSQTGHQRTRSEGAHSAA